MFKVFTFVLAVSMLASSAPAFAQAGTPTTSPNAWIALVPVTPSPEAPATLPKPQRLAEQARDWARNLAGLSSGACAAARSHADELRKAAVAISVADKLFAWRTAIVRTQTAVESLLTLTEPPHRCATLGAEGREVTRVRAGLDEIRTQLERVAAEEDFKPELPHSQKAASLLSAASASTTKNANQVAINPVDYFFSNHWRLYVRSTLVSDETPAGETDGDAPAADDAAPPSPDDVAEPVKLAMLDPYGGPLNLSAGYFSKIPTRFLVGDANDGHHGLFLDARAGLKFIELPEQSLALIKGETRSTPFYQASAALRLILPVYKSAPGADQPGGVELAVTGSVSRVADASASTLFASQDGADPILKKTVTNLHLAIAIDLPGWASLDLSGTLASNTGFDRRFLVGFRLSQK